MRRAVRATRSPRARPCSPTASSRRTSFADGWRRYGESTRVEFVPFGVDERAFAPTNRQASVDVVSIGADPHRDVELLLAVASELPSRSFRVVTTRDRARALGSAAAERRDRDRPSVRRDAEPARRSARRGASRPRQQLLRGDHCPAPGDGARQARRRLADEGDRERLRPRRRRQLPPRRARRRTRRSSVRWARCSGTSGMRARSARVRERPWKSGLTWDRYVGRIEAVLHDAARVTD